MALSKKIKSLLAGEQFADVLDHVPPAYDGRTAALKILREYFSELTFWRQGGRDAGGSRMPPIAFKVPKESIHVEWPDDENNLQLPSIAFIAQGQGDYAELGVTPNVIEDSRDKYAPNSVLAAQNEVQEVLSFEVWCRTKQERRGLKLGIESAMTPYQNIAGLRFRMPDYYDRLATYELQSYEFIDDEMATNARRKLRFVILLRYVQVTLVKLGDFCPTTDLIVGDVDGVLDSDPPAASPPD